MNAALTPRAAEEHVRRACFATGPPGRTGVELEWLVHDAADPHRPVPAERVRQALAPLPVLPCGGAVSYEPGGQLELSTAPAASLTGCLNAAAGDLAVLRRALTGAGLVPGGHGLDPWRDPPRVVDSARYRAMESFFAADGPWGGLMMRATAAVQVSLDSGDDSDGVTGYRRRWALAHRLGPVLVAAFANSPLWMGRPTGWRSTRQAAWARIDPGRARPAAGRDGCDGRDPRGTWARYALGARVLCVRRDPPADWSPPPGLTFHSWLAGASAGRPPTLADLDYHLSTLFPPVRPRGWLELRMIDGQRDDGWVPATAVPAVLLDHPEAAEAAWEATAPLCTDGGVPPAAVWARAARNGPADRQLGRAVLACFTAAQTALNEPGVPAYVRHAVAEFAERYAHRGRCPADDLLDAPPHPAPAHSRPLPLPLPEGAPS